MLEEALDFDGMMAQAYGPTPEKRKPEVSAMVTKLLSRADMLSSPEAIEAIKKEAGGLQKSGAWDLSSVRGQAEVASEARHKGASVTVDS